MNGQASEHAEQRGEAAEPRLTGTPSQIEWAVQIRRTISTEFDRVAAALEAVAQNQSGRAQSSTQAIIAILEEKRIEVLKNDRAGYFIKHWQELTDQVRLLIREDVRYQTLRSPMAEQASEIISILRVEQ